MSSASAPQASEAKTDNTKAQRPLTPSERNLRAILKYVQDNFDKIDCLALCMQAKPGQRLVYTEGPHRSETDYDFVSVDLPHVKEAQADKVGIHRTAAIEGMASRISRSFIGIEPARKSGMSDQLRRVLNELTKDS